MFNRTASHNTVAWGRGRKVASALVSGLLLVMLSISLASVSFADTTVTVQSGDTLSGLAARYGSTVEAIVAANNLSGRTIYAGQTLVIPSAGSQPAQPNVPAGGTTYVVQSGDTLSGIAARYGTTVDALVAANNLSSRTIYAGQTLRIVAPGSVPAQSQPQQPQPPATNPATYTVQPGDSLSVLAQRFGVTLQALADANGISAGSMLYVGQVLRIPGAGQQSTQPAPPTATSVPPPPTATPDPNKPLTHTVLPGENLSSIAQRYGTTVEALLLANNISNPSLLYSGQVLTIVKPGQSTSSGSGSRTRQAPAEPKPPMGEFGPKWVEVSISQQALTAYEGNTPVYTAKISSGRSSYPTIEGTFRVYAKYVSTRMRGGQGADYYDIPDVPYTMYFYSGYALHGAYWHNNFGTPQSQGGVNLSPEAARWLFDWAPIGTMVVTRK